MPVVLALLFSSPGAVAQGVTIDVTSTDPGTIQSAIGGASSGDIINFNYASPTTINVGGGGFWANGVTLNSGGAGSTTISASGSWPTALTIRDSGSLTSSGSTLAIQSTSSGDSNPAYGVLASSSSMIPGQGTATIGEISCDIKATAGQWVSYGILTGDCALEIGKISSGYTVSATCGSGSAFAIVANSITGIDGGTMEISGTVEAQANGNAVAEGVVTAQGYHGTGPGIKLKLTEEGTLSATGSAYDSLNVAISCNGSAASTVELVAGCHINGAIALSDSNVNDKLTLSGTSGSTSYSGNISGVNAIDVTGGTWTLSGAISDAAALTKTSTGTLTLWGANTYSGGTTVSAGKLVGNSTSLQGNIIDNAEVEFNQTTGGTYSGNLSGTGSLTKTGTGALTLSGSNTYSGGTTVSAGRLVGDTTSLQGNIIDNAAVEFNQGSASAFAGDVSGTGSLTKTGTGALTLSGSNTYSGGTTVSAGRLVGNTTSLQGNITDNAEVEFNQGNTSAFTGNISGSGSVLKSGTGALTVSGTNTYSGGTTVSAGRLIGNTESLPGNIINNAAVEFNQATSDGGYMGSMSGTGSLTKSGTGMLTLSGTNTYSGGTTVSGGRLIGYSVSLQGNITNNAEVEFSQAIDGAYTGDMSGTGSLTKLGTGMLTLSGTNTYSGGTWVLEGRLVGDTTSLQGNITNRAEVEFNQATAGTYAGVMSGDGSLIKSGSGTLTLSGTNTYSGGTTVSAGRLVGNTTSLQGNIANDAAVEFNQATGGTYAGDMSGTGSLAKSGTGTLTLSGANTYSGGTTVSEGRLVGNTTSLQGNITNNAAVEFNQATGGTYAGDMSGSGSLTKSGSGMLTLSGSNTYSGGTTVAEGSLVVNGSVSSATTVNQGATLRGNATLGDLTINGTVAPGNSIGLVTVNGAYTHDAGATYAVEINDREGNDRIHVNGSARINGGAVDVTAESGTYTAGMTYRILEATSRTGEFTGVTDNLPFLNCQLSYGETYVDLVLARSHMPYADVAQTRNQFATATYLDSLYAGATGDLSTIMGAIDSLTAADARAAFDHLGGEPYADLAGVDMNAANLFTDTAFYRLYNGADLDCAPAESGRRFWAYSLGNWQRQWKENAGYDSYYGYNNQLAGFMIGCDNQFDTVLLGFAGGYGESDVRYVNAPATDKTDVVNFSLYGKADFGNAYLAGIVGYTHGKNAMTRTILIDGLAARTASGSLGGNVFDSLMQAGYNFQFGRWRMTPIAGLRCGYAGMGDTAETGADSVNLAVGDSHRSSLTSHLGGRLAFCMTQKWRAEAYGQWEHEYADVCNDITMEFAGSPGTFGVRSAVAERDGARVGLTAIGELNKRVSLNVNYDALVRATGASQQFTGGLSIGF